MSTINEYLKNKKEFNNQIKTETKTYIKDPSQVPQGAQIKQGKRGGMYYEDQPGQQPKQGQGQKPEIPNYKEVPIDDWGNPIRTAHGNTPAQGTKPKMSTEKPSYKKGNELTINGKNGKIIEVIPGRGYVDDLYKISFDDGSEKLFSTYEIKQSQSKPEIPDYTKNIKPYEPEDHPGNMSNEELEKSVQDVMLSNTSTSQKSIELAKILNVPKEYIHNLISTTNGNTEVMLITLKRNLPLNDELKNWYATKMTYDDKINNNESNFIAGSNEYDTKNLSQILKK